MFSNKMGVKNAFVACTVLALVAVFSYSIVLPVFAGEHHPHISAALKELRETRHELKEAKHDFEGHREDALKAVDAAITQLEICEKINK